VYWKEDHGASEASADVPDCGNCNMWDSASWILNERATDKKAAHTKLFSGSYQELVNKVKAGSFCSWPVNWLLVLTLLLPAGERDTDGGNGGILSNFQTPLTSPAMREP
jgi:hypothetical protein